MSKQGLIRYPSTVAAPISRAVRAGDFVFLSGQTPKSSDLTPFRGDISAQTENVLDHIRVSLKELGLELDSVVRATVWLSDMKTKAEFNRVYESYFVGNLPRSEHRGGSIGQRRWH
jgi:2-iminobutanoate/2-iminopropanoate deaminase